MSEQMIRSRLAKMLRKLDRLERRGARDPRFPVVIGATLAAAIAACGEPTEEYGMPIETGTTTTTTDVGGNAGGGGEAGAESGTGGTGG